MNKKLLMGTAAAVAAACLSFVVFAGGDKSREAGPAPEAVKVASSEMASAALPDYDIIATVRALGYIPTTQAFRRGPYYVLHARDIYGTKLRVVADAQLGDIVSVRQVFTPRYDAGPRIIHVPQQGEPGRK